MSQLLVLGRPIRLLAVMVGLCISGALAFAQGSVNVSPKVVAPGGTLTVTFTAPAGLPSDAWIGLIPTNTPHGDEAENDRYDIAYQYLSGRTSGTMTFTAPQTPGSYDFRLFDTDRGGKELAYVTFTVSRQIGATISVSPQTVTPGGQITVTFSVNGGLPDNAWIGIIPSNTPHGSEAVNDQYDVAYQYLNGRTSGTMTFTAPQTPGSYDVRLNDTDSNGVELASATFNVGTVTTGASLTLGQSTVDPGGQISVSFTAPAGLPGNAWVGIVPSSTPHGSEAENDRYDVAYQYLNGRTSGTMTFTAPQTPGSYDFRLFDTDSDGKELASVTFVVR